MALSALIFIDYNADKYDSSRRINCLNSYQNNSK
jgi:hypothetical protein